MTQVVYEPGKVAGIKVTLGGQDYIVPALNVAGVERYEKEIEALSTNQQMTLLERLDVVSRLLLCALQRNYPTITLDFVKEWLDLDNMQVIVPHILAASGFEQALGGVRAGVSSGANSTLA